MLAVLLGLVAAGFFVLGLYVVTVST